MTKANDQSPTATVGGYHAVEEIRKIRDHMAEEMNDLTPEEQVAYVKGRAAKFRREEVKEAT